jgi:aspartyl-tRNA(Asn)/glutamyl-tRNA(Gln) amidotransferase subunit B
VQETRGWDDTKMKTFTQRTKEDAHDYRYFPDPDLPPVTLTDDYIADIKASMPVMPDEWRDRLKSLGLSKAQIETLLDAEVEFDGVEFLPLIESNMDKPEVAKHLANWNVNIFLPLVRGGGLKLSKEHHQKVELDIYELLKSNKLSSTNAKQLFADIIALERPPESIEAFANEKGYIQESDESAILAIVDQVLKDNAKAAEDVKNGEMKAIGFLVGQVMKASQGKANPGLAQQLIKRQLGL